MAGSIGTLFLRLELAEPYEHKGHSVTEVILAAAHIVSIAPAGPDTVGIETVVTSTNEAGRWIVKGSLDKIAEWLEGLR